MRITQWGEYGIQCALYMARRQLDGMQTVGAPEIAQSQDIALQYTQQILQRLRRGDIIKSVRGPHGGYCLSRSANDITLFDVLHAAEGDTFEVICETRPINHQRCATTTGCGLRVVWTELREQVDAFLKQRTLASVLQLGTNVQPLALVGRKRHAA